MSLVIVAPDRAGASSSTRANTPVAAGVTICPDELIVTNWNWVRLALPAGNDGFQQIASGVKAGDQVAANALQFSRAVENQNEQSQDQAGSK